MPEKKPQLPPRQEGKLNVYMHVAENSGVGYYRQYLPAVKIRDHGLANVLISDFRWGEGEMIEPDIPQLFEIANWADVIIVGRRDIDRYYALWGGIREFFNIPIILDTDDNVYFVRPFNPGYAGYHPGADALKWNKYAIEKVFDAITVSTEDLRKFYIKKNPRIYLAPNNLDLKEWDSHEKTQWKDGFISMAFIGSAAHTEGMNIIKKPVLDIMQKYPKVKFLVTHVYARIFEDFPPEIKKRVEFVPWIKLQDWPKSVKKLGIEIGLAPLADNMFNRAKSNLRWMEYCTAKMAVVASPVAPYLCIRDGIDGMIAKEPSEWFDAIEKLVTDQKLRESIAQEGYERVRREFDIDKNIGNWVKIYKEVHDKFHQFFGAKKTFEKLGKEKYRQIFPGRESSIQIKEVSTKRP